MQSAKHGVHGQRFFPFAALLKAWQMQSSSAYIVCEKSLSCCSLEKEVLAQSIPLAVVLDKST